MVNNGGVQYINSQTGLKFALSSVQNETQSDLHMRLQVPQKYGWGAIGLGSGMEGALMLIVYPSTNKSGVTLSTRTATDDSQPLLLKGIDCEVYEQSVANSIIDAAFVCYRIGDDPRLTSTTSKSSWIWAVGPTDSPVDTNAEDAQLSFHNDNYGYFLMDMSAARVTPPEPTAATAAVTNPASLIPQITGTSSVGTMGSVSTSPTDGLVNAHAIFLGGSFLFLFPLGIFLLRLRSVRLHWISQLIATIACCCGFCIAVAMCANTTEFSGFDAAHQILGILSVVLLVPQAALGFFHHKKFKQTGKGTWMAMPHLNLGRLIIILGMIAGVTGFALSDNTAGAVVYGISAALVGIAVVCLTVWDRRRRAGVFGGQDHMMENLTKGETHRIRVIRVESRENLSY